MTRRPSAWIPATAALAERLFSYSLLAPLMMVFFGAHLFAEGRSDAIGAEAVARGLEALYGPLDAHGLGARLYGIVNVAEHAAVVAGGLLADRWLGSRRALAAGAALMAVGYAGMAIDALPLLALPLVVGGAGAFAPSLVAEVHARFEGDDARRDGAFLGVYVAANLGMLLSPFSSGALAAQVGWSWAFGFACLAMVVAVAGVVARGGESAKSRRPRRPARLLALGLLPAMGVGAFGAMLVQCAALARWVDAGLVAAPFGLTVRGEMLLQLPVNAALVIVLSPIALLVLRRHPPRATLLATGCGLIAIGLLLPVPAADALERGDGAGWALASTLAMTLGELFVGPIALSLVTRVAPRRWVATAAASWIVARELVAEYPARAIGALPAGPAPLLAAAGLAAVGALLAVALRRRRTS